MEKYKKQFKEEKFIVSVCYNVDTQNYYFETNLGWTSPETDKSGISQELDVLDAKVIIGNHIFNPEILLDGLKIAKESGYKIPIDVNSSKFNSYWKKKKKGKK